MAERTSTRSASRRTTPQPIAQPVQTTRVTRSQSHDISDGENARTGARARQNRKQTPSEGVEDRVGSSRPKKGRGGMNNQSRALQDLSMVVEDPNVTYPELQVNRDNDGEPATGISETHHQTNALSKSPGGVSAFSGTTARTSRSVQELSDLSPEVMLEALLDLTHASDRMLSFLVPRELSEHAITAHMAQLQSKYSSANKNFRRLATTLSANRDEYGSESYIALGVVMGALVGRRPESNEVAGPWRPDALLQKANLAVLASSIFSRSWQTQDAPFVEELEHIFPMCFLEGFVEAESPLSGYSQLVDETFQLALDIRTQYAIMLLARHAGQPNFDPDAVLLQVFYKDAQKLRGWDVGGLRAEDLTPKVQDTVLARLKRLREAFATSDEDFATDIAPLQSTFPWTNVVMQAVTWISQRLEELNGQISLSQGDQQILELLKEEVQSVRSARSIVDDNGRQDIGSPQVVLEYEPPSDMVDIATDPQAFPRKSTRTKTLQLGQFSANSPKARSATDSLKRIEAARKAARETEALSRQQNRESTPEIQVTATAGPSTRALEPQRDVVESNVPSTAPAQILDEREAQAQRDDDWQPQDTDEGPLPPESERELRQVVSQVNAVRAQRQAESNKENIEFPVDQKRRFIDPQPNAQKVIFDESQGIDSNHQPSQAEDPSSDEGFQSNRMAANIVQQRNLKPALKRPSPHRAKSQRSPPKKARIQEISRQSGREAVGERLNDEPSPSPLLDEYMAANSAARERKAFESKPPQTRSPWSEEETETLLALIEEHGTSWALLLKEDSEGTLSSRGQVALKDKARNMKMDYLKSCRKLPTNFERIPISKLQIDTLAAQGIQYDRETGQRVDAIVEFEDE